MGNNISKGSFKNTSKSNHSRNKTSINEPIITDTSVSNFKKTKKNIYINFTTRLIFLILSIAILTFLSVKLISNGFMTTTTYELSYEEKSNLDYQVYLKENDYFDKNYLGKDLSYIANLIDYIKVNFNYNFNTSDYVNYNYSYYITGTVIATKPDDESSILYQKEYNLLPEKKLTKNTTNTYNITENLNINYAEYNNIINSFKSEYALSLDSKLVVRLYIKTKADYKDFTDSIDQTSIMELVIPLSEQTINITMDYTEANNTKTIEEYSNFETINIIYFCLGALCGIFDIIVLIKYFKLTSKMAPKNSNYRKVVNKLLKEYDRIITNVKNIPDLQQYNIINVTSFEELVDVSERIEKPILYCEIHRYSKCQFLVIDKDISYQYILKAVDLGDL